MILTKLNKQMYINALLQTCEIAVSKIIDRKLDKSTYTTATGKKPILEQTRKGIYSIKLFNDFFIIIWKSVSMATMATYYSNGRIV